MDEFQTKRLNDLPHRAIQRGDKMPVQGADGQVVAVDTPIDSHLGTFTTIEALEAVAGFEGATADVDQGEGQDVKRYIWDATDNKWVPQQGSSMPGTTDYNELDNRPSVNGVTLEGDLSTSQLGLAPGAVGSYSKSFQKIGFDIETHNQWADSESYFSISPFNFGSDFRFVESIKIRSTATGTVEVGKRNITASFAESYQKIKDYTVAPNSIVEINNVNIQLGDNEVLVVKGCKWYWSGNTYPYNMIAYYSDKENFNGSVFVGLEITGLINHTEKKYIVTPREGVEGIQNAIDFVSKWYRQNNSVGRHFAINIKNGLYIGSLELLNDNIDLIGESRDGTIIRNETGAYSTPPLNVSSGNLIKNITFDMVLSDPPPSEEQYGYAVHSDQTTGTDLGSELIFENCRLISDANSPYGAGIYNLRPHKFYNCEFVNKNANTLYGALFVHDHPSGGEQSIYFERCKFISNSQKVIKLQAGSSPDDCKVTFIGNTMYSSAINTETGKPYANDDSVVIVSTPDGEGYISGSMLLSGESWGNNVAILNSSEQV